MAAHVLGELTEFVNAGGVSIHNSLVELFGGLVAILVLELGYEFAI